MVGIFHCHVSFRGGGGYNLGVGIILDTGILDGGVERPNITHLLGFVFLVTFLLSTMCKKITMKPPFAEIFLDFVQSP